ncbi:MAG: ATP-binding protein [Rhizonema sp. NSF051]|nr:ATP-binding protein [Rhizonema sp. NSF051]
MSDRFEGEIGEDKSLITLHSFDEKALQQLAWAIESSVGQFKLILARCNYAKWRSLLMERLREICHVEFSFLILSNSEKTLYTGIREKLLNQVPNALMVSGLETVQNLDQMLSSANQVREEFRNNFPFPLVLWIDDEVHKQMMQFAPDLESWTTTKKFAIAPTELIDFLSQTAAQFFADSSTFSIENCREIKSAWQDLQNSGQVIEPKAQASIEYLLGLTEYVNHHLNTALEHYHRSLAFWQQIHNLERQGKVLSHITFCYYEKTRNAHFLEKDSLSILEEDQDLKAKYLQAARKSLRLCLKVFYEAQRPDLIANSIDKFGLILRDLKDWKQLKRLSEKALNLHEYEKNVVKIAQDYSFLAEVALANNNWNEARDYAEKALETLGHNQNNIPSSPSILYLFIRAQAEEKLEQNSLAISTLETARKGGVSDKNPQLYINILKNLQKLYFQQKRYLEAYHTRLERRSIEQKYGLRAFIGAGWLEATRQANLSQNFVLTSRAISPPQENITPEITASGRQLDVERLIERIARPDYKLIVIYGQSGVGKSSLVNAGLVPALKNKAIGIQDNLPVSLRVYTNWIEELHRSLSKALAEKGIQEDAENISAHSLLNLLRQSVSHNLRPVLIFDQFEEFIFVATEPTQRWQFFEFLGECLNILSVKVILSLRVDYLHYLLECNDAPCMNIISNDILSNNVLYKLGNFSPADAKSIIECLTNRSHFHLEPDLVDELVKDLAGELGEVRPIELQIVGAQLQAENITTLEKYYERGPKQELVKRYLAEVVEACGSENQQAAELVLYLLTDEKGTRPLKTRADLERNLHADFTKEVKKLDLVLEIFVQSGLVILLQENPTKRYQLVHDYLATFIRQQQEPKLNQLKVQLEEEKKQRKLSDAKLNNFLKNVFISSVVIVLMLAVLILTAWAYSRFSYSCTR